MYYRSFSCIFNVLFEYMYIKHFFFSLNEIFCKRVTFVNKNYGFFKNLSLITFCSGNVLQSFYNQNSAFLLVLTMQNKNNVVLSVFVP